MPVSFLKTFKNSVNCVGDKRKSEKKLKKFSEICYFELCFYQTLFRNDLSQKSFFTRKDIPANGCKQLQLEGYPTSLGKSSRADRVNISYEITL